MNNKKGFTLVELIAIIALIGIIAIIVGTNVTKGGENAKKSLLKQKIETIESAAVTYGQDNRNKFTTSCNGTGQVCYGIFNCYCYDDTITVGYLITKKALNPDQDSTDIVNPINNESLKECNIQIYTKYGKIYAIYDTETDKETCFYE